MCPGLTGPLSYPILCPCALAPPLSHSFAHFLHFLSSLHDSFIDENNTVPQLAEGAATSVDGGVLLYGVAKPMEKWTDAVVQGEVLHHLLRRLGAVGQQPGMGFTPLKAVLYASG